MKHARRRKSEGKSYGVAMKYDLVIVKDPGTTVKPSLIRRLIVDDVVMRGQRAIGEWVINGYKHTYYEPLSEEAGELLVAGM